MFRISLRTEIPSTQPKRIVNHHPQEYRNATQNTPTIQYKESLCSLDLKKKDQSGINFDSQGLIHIVRNKRWSNPSRRDFCR